MRTALLCRQYGTISATSSTEKCNLGRQQSEILSIRRGGDVRVLRSGRPERTADAVRPGRLRRRRLADTAACRRSACRSCGRATPAETGDRPKGATWTATATTDYWKTSWACRDRCRQASSASCSPTQHTTGEQLTWLNANALHHRHHRLKIIEHLLQNCHKCITIVHGENIKIGNQKPLHDTSCSIGFLRKLECVSLSHGNANDPSVAERNGNVNVPEISRSIVVIGVSYFVAIFRLILARLYCQVRLPMHRIGPIMKHISRRYDMTDFGNNFFKWHCASERNKDFIVFIDSI